MDYKNQIRKIIYKRVIIDKIIDQTTLAKNLGLTKQTINRWVNKNTPDAIPTTEMAPLICDLLKISLNQFYGLDEKDLTGIDNKRLKVIEKDEIIRKLIDREITKEDFIK